MAIFFTFSFLFLAMFGVSAVYGYLFPLRYVDDIATAATTFEVDPTLVASVINSESRYDHEAVSLKGAEGLMQILPSTAEYLAKKLKYGEYDLKNPEDNIMLGTYYLSTLIDQFQDEDLALCAYNAGPGNVKNGWQAKSMWTRKENSPPYPLKRRETTLKSVSARRSIITISADTLK